MSKKLKIGVLMGGTSSEREISLVTGAAVVKNLSKTKYFVVPIEITPDARFVHMKTGRTIDFAGADRRTFDCIFIALHGAPGENGGVQGMFETLGIAYTGPGVLSSALAMDKIKSAEMYQVYGINTPNFIALSRDLWAKSQAAVLKSIASHFKFPVVIKPSDQGSAVGVSIVKNKKELVSAITKTIKRFPNLLAQAYIRGQEATCGVLEVRGKAVALPPTHIVANFDEFYDYTSKYKPGGSTHICPADFSATINAQLQALALRAHQALGCRGMSRTDIMVSDDGTLWVLETNTIPGMTPTSLLPEAAAHAGITFALMLDHIIHAGLKR